MPRWPRWMPYTHRVIPWSTSTAQQLMRESELVVTNINQWVKEQKQGNEKLNFKIKDQSKKIIHLTAERDHLQESVEGLQEEMRLKAELEESRIEAERFRTCGQTSHPAAPHRVSTVLLALT